MLTMFSPKIGCKKKLLNTCLTCYVPFRKQDGVAKIVTNPPPAISTSFQNSLFDNLLLHITKNY